MALAKEKALVKAKGKLFEKKANEKLFHVKP